MDCKLCGAQLTPYNRCKAHILPASMLKEMAPEDYGSQIKVVGMDLPYAKNRPIGLYDPDILCRPCDGGILGKYDKCGIQFVKKALLTPRPSGAGWSAANIDQAKLKLFCLSYLWRASVTTLDDFKGVSLGDKHENAIRQMLLNDDAGSADAYSVNFARFNDDDKSFGGLLFPARTRVRNLTYYEAYLPGLYKFWVKVDSQVDPVISYASLGALPYVFVNDKGEFRTSREIQIMAKTVRGQAK